MAGDTTITIVGNLTADPELRFTPSGAAVANFTVASTPRIYDRQTGEWKDGEALFLRCNIWREAAENVAESLTRGHESSLAGGLSSGRLKPVRARSAPLSRSRSMRLGLRFGTPPPRSTRPAAAAGLAADPVRRRRRPAAPREMTRGAAHRRRVRSAAAMTNRHSDPKNCKSRNGKIDTHGQVQQAAPGSGKAGQDA